MGRLHARETCIRVREGKGNREEDVSEHASPSYLSLMITGLPAQPLPSPGARSPCFSYLHARRVGEADDPGPPKAGRRLRQKPEGPPPPDVDMAEQGEVGRALPRAGSLIRSWQMLRGYSPG